MHMLLAEIKKILPCTELRWVWQGHVKTIPQSANFSGTTIKLICYHII
jgi:hypothetical protein